MLSGATRGQDVADRKADSPEQFKRPLKQPADTPHVNSRCAVCATEQPGAANAPMLPWSIAASVAMRSPFAGFGFQRKAAMAMQPAGDGNEDALSTLRVVVDVQSGHRGPRSNQRCYRTTRRQHRHRHADLSANGPGTGLPRLL